MSAKRIITNKISFGSYTAFITAKLIVIPNVINDVIAAYETGDKLKKFYAEYHIQEIVLINNKDNAIITLSGHNSDMLAKSLVEMRMGTLATAEDLYFEYIESL